MKKLYKEIPEMTFFTGDTLPIFVIEVNREKLDDCKMKMVISRVKPPEENVIVKDCGKDGNCFSVHLWSLDTKNLTAGTYRISFIMTDKIGLEYVKLSGLMHVRSLTEG
ncbi:MAG: hypothetical protein K2I80_10395 [Ruminococcus sp.]|nr:hypothetical protein [Ruminococcus sp.]